MVFVFTFILISISVGQTYWERRYGYGSAQDIIACSSGGYILCGSYYDSGDYGWEYQILRLNESYDSLWIMTFPDSPDNELGKRIVEIAGGKFIIGGNHTDSDTMMPYFICIDSIGEILWTQTLRGGEFVDMCPSHYGGVVVMFGDIELRDTINIVEISEEGDSLWGKTFGAIYEDSYYGYDIDMCFDGGYIFAGRYIPSSGEPECFIMRLDDNGDSLWFAHYRIPWDVLFRSVSQCSDSGFVCAGRCMPVAMPMGLVVRYSKTGSRLWERRYGLGYDPEDWANAFWDVLTDSSGGFWIIGSHPIIGCNDAWLLRFDDDGDTLWSIRFTEEGGRTALQTVIQNPDGGILAAGWTSTYPTYLVGVIEEQSIEIILPNGGEIWEIRTVHNVFWESDGIANVTIEYSTDGGGTWLEIESSILNSEHYEWTIPSTPSDNCLLKISDAANPAVFDISNEPFEITSSSPSPEITVISPNGGEIWISGSEQIIRWNSTGVDNVSIDYSINSGMEWISIIDSTLSNGFFEWIIPVHNSTNCLVRITDIDMSSVSDMSDVEFEIDNTSPSIILINPTEGDTLLIDSTIIITWIYDEIDDTVFQVLYSLDDGETFPYFEGLVEGSSYEWTVPDFETDVCRIKICTLDSTTGSGKETFSPMDGEPIAEVISPPFPIRHSVNIKHFHKPFIFSLKTDPNPFNSSCKITVNGNAKIDIYDLQGNVVERFTSPNSANDSLVVASVEMSTIQTFIWKPDESISSGIYFVTARIEDGRTATRKLMFIR